VIGMPTSWFKPWLKPFSGLAGLLIAMSLTATPAQAADFYAGKQITMIVGSAVGGGYDTYARLVARHWSKHIPGNPPIIIQNMPAAGSVAAMNALANTAPRDGTTIGAVQTHVGIEPIMGVTGPVESMRFDGRTMNWIGSATKEIPVVAAWSNSPIKTFEDTFKREMLVGSSGQATADTVYPRILNATLGTKFKVVAGYKSNNELIVAAERGETMGRAGWFVSGMLATQGQQIADGKILVLVQLAWEKHPELPNVPLISKFVSDPVKRDQVAFSLSWLAMGRPFVAPPGVPADRVKLLRDSFMQAMADPALIAEAKRLRLDVIPMSGEDVQALVGRLYDTPRSITDPVRAIMLAK
jgi:tripartite-type tricarboxylate transporter receptor subunit TctC